MSTNISCWLFITNKFCIWWQNIDVLYNTSLPSRYLADEGFHGRPITSLVVPPELVHVSEHHAVLKVPTGFRLAPVPEGVVYRRAVAPLKGVLCSLVVQTYPYPSWWRALNVLKQNYFSFICLSLFFFSFSFFPPFSLSLLPTVCLFYCSDLFISPYIEVGFFVSKRLQDQMRWGVRVSDKQSWTGISLIVNSGFEMLSYV